MGFASPGACVDVGVKAGRQVGDAGGAGLQGGQDLGLAPETMGDVGVEEGVDLAHRRAMGRPEGGEMALADLFQAFHVGAHVAIRRGHHRRRPAHHMVAAEEGVLLKERIADVRRGVAGRGDGLDGPALTRDPAASAEVEVGSEADVIARHHPHGLYLGGVRGQGAAARHHRAGARLEGGGQRRMVQMVVGDEDVADALARHSGQQGLQMVRVVRAGIDDRHHPLADDVGAGAGEGERAGVVGDHPSDQRGDLVRAPVLELYPPDEGDHSD